MRTYLVFNLVVNIFLWHDKSKNIMWCQEKNKTKPPLAILHALLRWSLKVRWCVYWFHSTPWYEIWQLSYNVHLLSVVLKRKCNWMENLTFIYFQNGNFFKYNKARVQLKKTSVFFHLKVIVRDNNCVIPYAVKPWYFLRQLSYPENLTLLQH